MTVLTCLSFIIIIIVMLSLMEFTVTVDTEPSKVEVGVSKTQVHTIKIVLPVHANHHGTTFGGQVCRKASVQMTLRRGNGLTVLLYLVL